MAAKARSDRWRDWAMLALAVWLFLSPWILGFTVGAPVEGAIGGEGITLAAWNAWILGLVIALLALWAAFRFAEWHDWVNGVLGVWLVVAPWTLGFAALAAAVWNHVIVGLLIVALAGWELWDVRHHPTPRRAT